MKPSEEPVTISFGAFESIVKRYEGHVPKDLFGLEEIRLKEVPETLAQRKREGRAFLEKTEVTALTEWKLCVHMRQIKPLPMNISLIVLLISHTSKHGTYRPNLAKLVASNTVKDIRAATETSFSTYESNTSDPLKAFAPLTKLKGIGPATASLLLSCYDPSNLPFFSDELYRYTHWEEAKNKGWDRKIGYTMKEYKELFKRVHEMKTRLESESKTSVNAVDIEKAAYVLGKEAQRYPSFLKRKDDEENDTALQPPPPKKRKKRTPSPIPLGIQRVSECRRKGLRGSPTYDELGFELDKEVSAVQDHLSFVLCFMWLTKQPFRCSQEAFLFALFAFSSWT